MRRRFLRHRPDHRGPGRRGRLERAILGVHVFVLSVFALVVGLPLARDGAVTLTEGVVRGGLVLALLGVALDLWRRGERLSHLAVLGTAAAASLALDLTPYAGDISVGLMSSAVLISAARLLTLEVFVVVNLVSVVVVPALRASVSEEIPTVVAIDSSLLTAALSLSIAFFVGALEARADVAERLDEQALRQERELLAVRSREQATDAAARVLHDEVLTALRVVGDADPERPLDLDAVRHASRRAAAAVREVTDGESRSDAALAP